MKLVKPLLLVAALGFIPFINANALNIVINNQSGEALKGIASYTIGNVNFPNVTTNEAPTYAKTIIITTDNNISYFALSSLQLSNQDSWDSVFCAGGDKAALILNNPSDNTVITYIIKHDSSKMFKLSCEQEK